MDFVSKASEELGADDRSEVCDDIVRNYVDEYASFFILCAFSKRLHEPFSYGDLYNPELEDYINFQETLELWEDEEAEDLGEIIVYGLFNYCIDSTGKFPYKSQEFYHNLWKKNIVTGMKALKMRNPFA